MKQKQVIRQKFKEDVFRRDKSKCVTCKREGRDTEAVDAHHIEDRHNFKNGGYVLENGISLCADCHWKAEQYHIDLSGLEQGEDAWVPNFYPIDLYDLIGSSREKAYKADLTK